MQADTSQIPVPTQPKYPFRGRNVRLRPATLAHFALLDRELQGRAQEGGSPHGCF